MKKTYSNTSSPPPFFNEKFYVVKFGTHEYLINEKEISYVYENEGITFLVDLNNFKYPAAAFSIDTFYTQLNSTQFYKLSPRLIVNREVIAQFNEQEGYITTSETSDLEDRIEIPNTEKSVFPKWFSKSFFPLQGPTPAMRVSFFRSFLLFLFSTLSVFSQGNSIKENSIDVPVPSLEKKELFELSAWYGFAFLDDQNTNGIRRADVKFMPDSENLIYAFYDNALVLENKFLASQERSAPIVGIGAKHDWSSFWFSKVEVGRRFLSIEEDQTMFNTENGFFLSERSMAKFILQYDIRQNDNLLTLGALYEYKVFKNFSLEGGFFHSENLTLQDHFTERALLTSKIQLKSSELILGSYYDILQTNSISANQLGGAYGLFVFPLAVQFKGKFLLVYDKGFYNNEVVVVSLGGEYKF